MDMIPSSAISKRLKLKRVLVLSYPFAPNAVVGAKRMTALTRIMQKNKVICDIITADSKYYMGIDNTIATKANMVLRTKVAFGRTYNRKPVKFHKCLQSIYCKIYNLLGMVDLQQGWNIFAIKAGLKLIKQFEYNAIIVTGPPFSSYIAAEKLSDISKLPYILDYRDPWNGYGWERRTRRRRDIEERIVSKASGIVLCSDTMRADFVKYFPCINRNRITVITNGFDLYQGPKVSPNPNTINLSHSGSLYGERTLNDLANPMQILNTKLHKPLQLHHWGPFKEECYSTFKEVERKDALSIHSRITQKELKGYLAGSDILVAISGGDVNYALPFKVFDYLSTGIPILAITPLDSELARFVKIHKSGYAAPFHDIKRIQSAMEHCLILKKVTVPHNLTWETLGKRYIRFIEYIISDRGPIDAS